MRSCWVSKLDDDETGISSIDTRSENGVEQKRDLLIVNESGLYSLILTSRKPEVLSYKDPTTALKSHCRVGW